MSDNNLSRAQAWGLELMNRNIAALNGSGIGEGVGAFVSLVQSLAAIAPFGNLIVGTKGNDTLSADGEGDVVLGLGGEDELSSAFNRTALLGGKDGDILTTNVFIPRGTEPADGLAVQFGGQGKDTLAATVTIQGGFPPPIPGARTATILLDGGSDNDVIRAEARVDSRTTADVDLRTEALGGSGNDVIDLIANAAGANGRNTVANVADGGAGNDRITALAQTEFVGHNGTATNELTGGDGDDFIDATAITWSLNNLLASNILSGGRGNDELHAFNRVTSNAGFPVSVMELRGDAGNDILQAVSLNGLAGHIPTDSSHLDGGTGNDVLSVDTTTQALVATSHNLLEGGSGNDTLTAKLAMIVLGGPGAISQPEFEYEASNILDGGTGNDSLNASFSIEDASGRVDNSHAENRLSGGSGNDQLTAFAELTRFASLPGAITNHLDGGNGRDILVATIAAGTDGTNFLDGGSGDDHLTVFGGSGNELNGGQGRDTLVSGTGNDLMNGGADADTFVFAPANGADTVTFVSGEDTIDLTAFATSNIHAFGDLTIEIAGNDSIIRFDADNSITVLDTTALNGGDFLFA